jgi:hypothetical protein
LSERQLKLKALLTAKMRKRIENSGLQHGKEIILSSLTDYPGLEDNIL